MKLEEARRDHYRKLARKEGYRSRAAYKLVELDDRRNLISQGSLVLDFGCAPGGWMQVSSERVGDKGLVIGIDKDAVEPPGENCKTLTMDILDQRLVEEVIKLAGRKADVILSDLAPKVSGIWELDEARQTELTNRLFSLLPELLRMGGNAVFKVFQGEDEKEVIRKSKVLFGKASVEKPPASRKESSEFYLVCLNYLAS